MPLGWLAFVVWSLLVAQCFVDLSNVNVPGLGWIRHAQSWGGDP